MSKKKKRHANSSASVRTRSQAAALADEKDRARKRMNPIARNLLLGDVVFLAICQILYQAGMLSDLLSGVATIVGIALLMSALWFQFGKKDIDNSGRPGGLGGSGGWPLLK